MISAILAVALAQTCDFSQVACYNIVSANETQSYIYAPQGSSGGIVLQSRRQTGDGSADFTFQVRPNQNRSGLPSIEVRNSENQVVFRVSNDGQVQAGGDGQEAAFRVLSTADGKAALDCSDSSGPNGGCYLTLQARMNPSNNGAFHGLLTVGNQWGYPDGGIVAARDGGLALQLQGTGKSNAKSQTYPGTIFAVDDFGNMIQRDGYIYQNARKSDQRACIGVESWNGEWRAPGGYAFIQEDDAINLCTSTSSYLDGGYEKVCTDINGLCNQLPPGISVSDSGDAIVFTKTMPGGAKKYARVVWTDL